MPKMHWNHFIKIAMGPEQVEREREREHMMRVRAFDLFIYTHLFPIFALRSLFFFSSGHRRDAEQWYGQILFNLY